MKQVQFAPQELLAVIAGTVAKIGLEAIKLPADGAALAVSLVEAVTKGLSRAEQKSTPEQTLAQELQQLLGELEDGTKARLEPLLQPKKLIDFMCRPDRTQQLRRYILHLCANDRDSDFRLFDPEELVSQVEAWFEECVMADQQLTVYMTYRMTKMANSPPPIHTANDLYARSFMEPMFLHREDKRVTLENLFVRPKHTPARTLPNGSVCNILDDIGWFLQRPQEEPFLIIEGDAGSGKTTLMAYLNYLDLSGDKLAGELFEDRPIVTIRLRDLNKDKLQKELGYDLPAAICEYMHLDSLDALEEQFPRAIMLLDGFDELCMIERLDRDNDELLHCLHKRNLKDFQFIVTTRLGYISQNIDLPNRRFTLKHFDRNQRRQWISQYKNVGGCNRSQADDICNYLENVNQEDNSCICDTPMVLYMLAGKKDALQYLENDWALYNHIFGTVLSETEYNAMIPDKNRRKEHPIQELQEAIYRVSEEIAYRMYKRGNQILYLQEEELKEIIQSLAKKLPVLQNTTKQLITKKCYALCCYWKQHTKQEEEKGAVEFLHNNIRDFFLAEKLYREMDTLYKDGPDPETIAKKLAQLLPYGVLEARVVDFLHLRAVAKKGKPHDFAQQDRNHQNSMASKVMTALSGEAIFVRDTFGPNEHLRERKVNAHQRTLSIVKNTAYVYQAAFQAHVDPDNVKDRISWLEMESRHYSLFCSLASKLLSWGRKEKIAPGYYADLRDANLQGADLRGANLHGANLQGANLQGANLQGANLQGANLQDANLRHAGLHGANLQGADLRGANLHGANLQGANLQGANLQGANLQDANLRGANLQGTDLRGANLWGADLQNADLRLANLWGEDLHNSNLQGADLRLATLRGVYLLSANLRGANLQGADLRGANLQRADLQSAYLWNTDLQDADLRDANLWKADLKGANLRYTMLPVSFCSGNQEEQIAHLKSLNIPGLKI